VFEGLSRNQHAFKIFHGRFSESFSASLAGQTHPLFTPSISDSPNSPKLPQRTDAVINLFTGTNLSVGIKKRLTKFDADRPVMPARRRPIAASVLQLSAAAIQSVSTTTCVRGNDQLVDRFDVSR
jgi:hypothetical protein